MNESSIPRPEEFAHDIPAQAEEPAGGEDVPPQPLDLKVIREEAEMPQAALSCLQIVLELIARERSRVRLRPSFPTLLKNLAVAARDPSILERAACDFSELIRETDLPEAKEILYALLSSTEDPCLILRTLEGAVKPHGPEKLVDVLLEWFSRREGRRAILLLADWSRECRTDLQPILEEKFLSLTENRVLLGFWAKDDPVGFREPRRLRKVLERAAPEVIREGFKELFSSVSPAEGTAFIRGLPGRIPKAEHILFSAIDHGHQEVRIAALEELRRYPTAMVISTLIEIVNRNNFPEHFSAPDVRAALDTLSSMDDPVAKGFLRGIAERRAWRGQVYLKEIRKVLLDIPAKELQS